MASITIRTQAGKRIVRAKMYGDLAVHKTIGFSGRDTFTITHVPTGYAVAKGSDGKALRFFAGRLASLPVWNFKRPKAALRIVDDVRAAWSKADREWKTLQRANGKKPQPVSIAEGSAKA